MAYEPELPNIFNPILMWTDLGMRAAEATVASTQNFTEGADRLTRAVAGAGPTEILESTSADEESADTTPSGGSASGITSMQLVMWELMTQNWVRWMSSVGNLLAAGVGVNQTRVLTGRDNPLKAVRESLRPAAWGEKPATERPAKSRSSARSNQRRHGSRK